MPIDSKLLKVINASNKSVERITLNKVSAIIALCERCRSYSGRFTFEIAEVEAQVDAMLSDLSDGILEEVERKLLLLLEYLEWEDYEDYVSPYLTEEDNGMTLLGRIKNYTEILKDSLEGWIAIGFALGLTAAQIMASFIAFADNPMASETWRLAAKSGKYKPGIFRSYGSVGKGYLRNPMKGYGLLITNTLTKLFHRINIRHIYRAEGAIGFRVHRGSSYFCPVCDANCVGIHALSESDILPTHPRCVCWTTPVFLGDDIE